MKNNIVQNENKILFALRREWSVYVIFSILFILLCFTILLRGWEEKYVWRWLVVTAALSTYQFIFLYRNLSENRLKADYVLFPNLGLANWITLTRATFNAVLAGFLFGAWPTGWLAWAPSILYLVSALMDYADGFIARVSGRTTILGETLDMKWDGVGVLIAASLSVLYGQTPLPFLLVGLARYIFLFGVWFRARRGQPMYELPPNRFRRAFAGMMMGFLAVILMPVYQPPATHVAAWLFMIPFLMNFLSDWLYVSGVLHPNNPENSLKPRINKVTWRIIFPLIIRSTLIIFLVELLIHVLGQKPLDVAIVIVLAFAIPALLLGTAGRLFSLVVLLMTGFGLQAYPLEWRFWDILLLSAISMMVGTGRYSLWKPEDWLMYKHAGESHRAAKLQR